MKKINALVKIFSILFDISLIFLLINIYKLNVIPNKYLSIIFTLIILLGISITLISIKVKDKKVNIMLNIILLLLIVGSIVLSYYIIKTDNFFSSLEEVKEEQLYYVVVKKNSDYKKLDDLNNKIMAIFENQSKNDKKVLNEIEKNVDIKDKKYINVNDIVNDLSEGKVDSLLINSNNKELLDENVKTFKDNTKVIDKISIDVIKQREKDYKNTYGPFNILISGIDTDGNISKVSRSDVNIVVSVNQNTHKILLTSIQRDMYVQLHGTDGLKDKLTHAGWYGIDMSRTTIEDFLNIEIPYYIRINFDSVVKLIDTVGGVDIYNDVTFRGDTRYFAKGNIHLNGKQALEYARERKKMPDGDWTREEHQKVIITAIINKISNSKELLTNYGDILNNSKDLIQTNIPTEVIKKYVKDQLENMNSWEVSSASVAGKGFDYRETYSMPGMDLYVTYPDEDSVKSVSKQIKRFLNEK